MGRKKKKVKIKKGKGGHLYRIKKIKGKTVRTRINNPKGTAPVLEMSDWEIFHYLYNNQSFLNVYKLYTSFSTEIAKRNILLVARSNERKDTAQFIRLCYKSYSDKNHVSRLFYEIVSCIHQEAKLLLQSLKEVPLSFAEEIPTETIFFPKEILIQQYGYFISEIYYDYFVGEIADKELRKKHGLDYYRMESLKEQARKEGISKITL